MTLTYAPQSATTVVVVRQADLPGVLVNEEVTLRIDMPLPLLHVTLNFPYAVQLETRMLRIHVTGLQYITVFQIGIGQPAGVIRQVDFLLADQLPVVAIRRTVVHGEVIRCTHTVRCSTRAVVGHLRRTAHTALTGVVYPSHTWLFQLIETIVYQQHVTGESCRRIHPLLEEQQSVRHGRRVDIGHQVWIADFFFQLDQCVRTIGLRHSLHVPAMHVETVARHVVPDDFGARLGNREYEGSTGSDVLDTISTVDQLGLAGSPLDLVVELLRIANATVSLINRHTESFWIAL